MSPRRCFAGMVHTGRVPYSQGKTLADQASSWMQVMFGGLGVSVAIVAAVIAYFAWVQPQSPAGDGQGHARSAGSATPAPTPPTVPANSDAAAQIALHEFTPMVGAGTIRRSGDDLVMRCATGQSTDLLRIAEYDLLGRYQALEAELRVLTARDADTPLQLRIIADGPEIANHVLTKGGTAKLNVPLTGKQRMRFQLSCQFADGEMTLKNPKLIHS